MFLKVTPTHNMFVLTYKSKKMIYIKRSALSNHNRVLRPVSQTSVALATHTVAHPLELLHFTTTLSKPSSLIFLLLYTNMHVTFTLIMHNGSPLVPVTYDVIRYIGGMHKYKPNTHKTVR